MAVEDSVWSNNHTDKVIIFLCEVPDGAKTKNMVDAITMLESVKLTQQNWVEYGTRIESCLKPWLRHNVSNTITIKPDEWEKVSEHIYKNRQWYTGISMLPLSGDKDYQQSPFTSVSTPFEIVKEHGDGSIMASGLIVDGLREFNNNLWEACDCVLGTGEIIDTLSLRKKIEKDCETNGVQWKSEGLSPDSPEKLLSAWLKEEIENYEGKVEWVRRAKQFAIRYFGCDMRKMTYCLKDVANWKLWCDLHREYVDVDWSAFYEDSDGNLDYGRAGSACSGGACDLGDLGISISQSKIEKSKNKRLVEA
jgi:ribonucleoside-diphosphate reductase alpha chain